MAANIENTFSNIDGETKNSNDKNILILSMSTLPQSLNINKYWADLSDGENKYCFFKGISQLEAGTKYWMTRLGEKKVKLDRIIINASEEARKKYEFIKTIEKGSLVIKKVNNEKKVKANDEVILKSAVDVYKEDIKEFALGDKKSGTLISDERYFNEKPHIGEKDWKSLAADFNNLKKLSVELTEDRIIKTDKIDYSDRINTLFTTVEEQKTSSVIQRMSELYSIIRKEIPIDPNTKKPNGRINIYMDAQGGMRTFFNLMFSLFSMQNQKTICIKGVSAIDFEKGQKINQIRDVTDEFQTIDLVSAVKAFSQYGRGDLLMKYQNNAGKKIVTEDQDKDLGKTIKEIADAISISDPSGFDQGIETLRGLQRIDPPFIKDTSPYYFLWKDIQDKYDELLTNDSNDVLTTVKWCIENQFYQQALSLIEDKMPAYILKHFFHIYYKKKNEAEWNRVDTLNMDDYEKRKEIENITGDKTFYVSLEGKFLYKYFNYLRSKMDKKYTDEVCYQIVDSHLQEETIVNIILAILKENSEERRFRRINVAHSLLEIYLKTGNYLTVGELIQKACEINNSNQSFNTMFESVNQLIEKRIENGTVIDNAFINSFNPDEPYNSQKERFFREAFFAIKGSKYKKECENSFKCICSAFQSLFGNVETRDLYFQKWREEMVGLLVEIVNSRNEIDIELNRAIMEDVKDNGDCSEDNLTQLCYGTSFANKMEKLYGWNDPNNTLKSLIERILDESDLEAYIRFRRLVNQIQKNYGNYRSGCSDYNELVHLEQSGDYNFPFVVHSAHHKYSVLGLAVDFDNVEEQEKQEISQKNVGFKSMEKSGDLIQLIFERNKYLIRCEIPSKTSNNNDNTVNLDRFLGLHEALKQERNVCNHASENGKRLSVKGIRYMLDLYCELADELQVME